MNCERRKGKIRIVCLGSTIKTGTYLAQQVLRQIPQRVAPSSSVRMREELMREKRKVSTAEKRKCSRE